MKAALRPGSLLLMLSAPAAHAALPDEVLDKDYQNCMGGTEDQHRAVYCGCIRNAMQSWDLDAYGAMATNISNAGNNAKLPDELSSLAQSCLAQALQ